MNDFSICSNEELVKLCRDNNPDAWNELVNRFMPTLKILAGKFSQDPDSGYDDLISDGIFYGLFNAVIGYDADKSSFVTFASVCIRNAMLNTIEKKNGSKKIPDNLIVSVDKAKKTAIVDSESKEQLYEITSSFDTLLTEKERICFVMHLMGYSYKEIATRVESTEKSVEKAISRARKKIHTEFD